MIFLRECGIFHAILSSPRQWSMMVPHTTTIRYRPSTAGATVLAQGLALSSPGGKRASALMRGPSPNGRALVTTGTAREGRPLSWAPSAHAVAGSELWSAMTRLGRQPQG